MAGLGGLLRHHFLLLCHQGTEVTIQHSEHSLNTRACVLRLEHHPGSRGRTEVQGVSLVVRLCVQGRGSSTARGASNSAWRGLREREEKEMAIRTGVCPSFGSHAGNCAASLVSRTTQARSLSFQCSGSNVGSRGSSRSPTGMWESIIKVGAEEAACETPGGRGGSPCGWV